MAVKIGVSKYLQGRSYKNINLQFVGFNSLFYR